MTAVRGRKVWAVVNKGGHVIAVAIRRKEAMESARGFLTWNQLRRWGCRAIPVTIQEARHDER